MRNSKNTYDTDRAIKGFTLMRFSAILYIMYLKIDIFI